MKDHTVVLAREASFCLFVFTEVWLSVFVYLRCYAVYACFPAVVRVPSLTTGLLCIALIAYLIKAVHKAGHCLWWTPFRLRDDIPRDSITPGPSGTICLGCDHRGNGIYTFPWRGSRIYFFLVGDAFVRARVFAVITGPRDYPESRTKPREKSRRMP